MSRVIPGSSTGAVSRAVSAGEAEKVVVVDLSDRPSTSKIVRAGFEVPAVAVDKSKFGLWSDTIKPLPGNETPRVVSQSIEPGTKVPRGTAVDLILAPPIQIPFEIFVDVHEGFKDRTLADPVVTGLLDDPKVREPLLRYDRPEDVPVAEREFLTERFQGADIAIDETAPDRSFGKAFASMKTAAAFR